MDEFSNENLYREFFGEEFTGIEPRLTEDSYFLLGSEDDIAYLDWAMNCVWEEEDE